jgi:hypothetical protein
VNTDDQAVAKASRIDGAAVHLDWPDAAEAAREATFRRLHSLVREKDPMPADVLVSARSSFGMRSIDDEPAALVYDSIIDDDLLSSVRSGGRTVRQLTFEARDLVLEVEVSGAGHLVGQVVPPQATVVELRHRGGTTPVVTDELGCFHVPAMPDGPVSFRCRPTRSAAHSVATSWITL